jgi:hypothetical protein
MGKPRAGHSPETKPLAEMEVERHRPQGVRRAESQREPARL